MSRDTKKLVMEISIGILLYSLAAFVIAGIWFRKADVFLGLALGAVGAVAMIVHMACSLEHSIALGEEGGASSYMRRMYFVRFAIVVVVFLLAYFTNVVNIFAVIIGALGLKAAAYLQPFLHKAFTRGEA